MLQIIIYNCRADSIPQQIHGIQRPALVGLTLFNALFAKFFIMIGMNGVQDRPADVLLPNHAGGRHAALDFVW